MSNNKKERDTSLVRIKNSLKESLDREKERVGFPTLTYTEIIEHLLNYKHKKQEK